VKAVTLLLVVVVVLLLLLLMVVMVGSASGGCVADVVADVFVPFVLTAAYSRTVGTEIKNNIKIMQTKCTKENIQA
jgi:hypothetical protein